MLHLETGNRRFVTGYRRDTRAIQLSQVITLPNGEKFYSCTTDEVVLVHKSSWGTLANQ